jgi:hypothetical protein
MNGAVLGKTEDEILAAVIRYDHWPLEVSLTPSALKHVELALEQYLGMDADHRYLALRVPAGPRAELWNTCNILRAHLQHVVLEAREAAAKPDVSDLI